jgi:hypothetical protein
VMGPECRGTATATKTRLKAVLRTYRPRPSETVQYEQLPRQRPHSSPQPQYHLTNVAIAAHEQQAWEQPYPRIGRRSRGPSPAAGRGS